MFDLSGKRAFVTGGSSGIGRAVAEAFVELGAHVVIGDIIDASDVAEAIGASAVHCDVADEQSMSTALNTARDTVGSIDIVVLNAGVGDVGPTLTEVDQDLIEKVTRINHWGVVYGLKHAPTVMRDGGSIISTSSLAAFLSLPGASIYSASKRAVVSLTETAAVELGSRGIRVNCVCPGYTDTAMGSGDEGKVICEAFTALGRPATVEDLVGTYAFLAGSASRYITGQAFKVDGGWSAGVTPELLKRITGQDAAPS